MDEDRLPGFATLAVHAGKAPIRLAAALSADGSSRPNIFREAEDPLVAALGERIAALESGTAGLAVASGEAAKQLLFQTLLRPGDEFVASTDISGGSFNQFDQGLKSFGWEVRWADPDQPGAFERAISPKTKAIFVETISGARNVPADLARLAQFAKRAQVPLIVDNTLATPFLCRPIEHGADLVVHSADKFLGGHGGSPAGIIVDGGTFDWLREGRYPLLSERRPELDGRGIAEAFGNFAFLAACRGIVLPNSGTGLSSLGALGILRGIETLPLRIARQSANAGALAEYLAEDRRVDWVRYPGLPGDRHYNIAAKYLVGGAGPLIRFGLGSADAAAKFLSRTRLFGLAADFGGTRSVVVEGGRLQQTGSLGLSVGIEAAADLIADLDQALGA